jgi:hypothetical protein
MKEIELNPTFKSGGRQTEEGSGYIALHTTVLMPMGIYNMIKDSLVAVETDWKTGNHNYKRCKDQKLTTFKVPFENAVAMIVAERLED